MSIIETLFAEMCAAMDKFTARMASDDFLGTAEERELDARINAFARAIAATPTQTKADASVKLAALSRWNHGGAITAADFKTEEIAAELAASYIRDVTALAAASTLAA
jgi:hypothetical protein